MQLKSQIKDSLLQKARFKSWDEVFDALTDYLSKQDKKVMLILCGSIASFMVKKVIRSKALYGRFSLELHVKKLSLFEAALFFKSSKSKFEILKYILVLGGVPKYLEEIDQKNLLSKISNDYFLARMLCILRNLIKFLMFILKNLVST